MNVIVILCIVCYHVRMARQFIKSENKALV